MSDKAQNEDHKPPSVLSSGNATGSAAPDNSQAHLLDDAIASGSAPPNSSEYGTAEEDAPTGTIVPDEDPVIPWDNVPKIGGFQPNRAGKGKSPKPKTGDDEDVFVLASRLEAVLRGVSNKMAAKALNMVGSLHGYRSISVDRPIGQVNQPKQKTKAGDAKGKGKSPSAKAAWKQTTEYSQLNASRATIVARLKATPATDPNKDQLTQELRTVEQRIRGLRPGAGESPSSA